MLHKMLLMDSAAARSAEDGSKANVVSIASTICRGQFERHDLVLRTQSMAELKAPDPHV